jgi:protein-S-isoprenylcysteine O-methyltransferase Ste14
MADDFEAKHRLRTSTLVAVYLGYSGHLVLLTTAPQRAARSMSDVGPPARVIGPVLAGSGLALLVAGIRRFPSAAQVSGIEPGRLVCGGIYSRTRNPQYLGYLLSCAGLSIARRSLLAGVLSAAAAITLNAWAGQEERHLAKHFGAPYIEYRNRVPRW